MFDTLLKMAYSKLTSVNDIIRLTKIRGLVIKPGINSCESASDSNLYFNERS